MEEFLVPEQNLDDIEEKEQGVEEEPVEDSLDNTLPEMEGKETDFDNSLSEFDEWVADETVVSETLENTEAELELETIVDSSEPNQWKNKTSWN